MKLEYKHESKLFKMRREMMVLKLFIKVSIHVEEA